MLRYPLILLICVLVYSDMLEVGLSFGGGLSLRNLLEYLAVAMLVLQRTLGIPTRVELRPILSCFVLLIVYALASSIFASSVMQYKGYTLLDCIVQLKILPVDWLITFAAFFYGCRTKEDASQLIKTFLAAVSVGNAFTVAKVLGAVGFGANVIGSGDDAVARVDGIYGDANETGTFIAFLLPAFAATTMSSNGLRRIMWLAGMAASCAVLFMTASRGALVSLAMGSIWAAIICRRYLPLQRMAIGAVLFGSVSIGLLSVFGGSYWVAFANRFASVASSNASDVSSGRTDIWAQALNLMMSNPVTLITGFGWNTWPFMGFRLAAHNTYLWLWFELGLPGVILFIMILRLAASAALASLESADPLERRIIISYVFGLLIFSIGAFFLPFTKPWIYFWAFMGLMLRYAISVRSTPKENLVKPQPVDNPRKAIRLIPSGRSRTKVS
jgi:O-antigen ligase